MTTTDPYGQYFSSYIGMGNNPINGVDPDGGLFGKWRAERWARKNGGESYYDGETKSWWAEAGITNGVRAKNFGAEGLGFSFRDVNNFAGGFSNAVVTNHTLGIGRQDFDDAAFQNGQFAGDVVSVLMGAAEAVAGTTIATGGAVVTVGSLGTLSVVGVPAVGVGSAIAVEGAATTGVALGNVMVHFAHKRPNQSTGSKKRLNDKHTKRRPGFNEKKKDPDKGWKKHK
jgi:hypothetical protein